MFFFNFTKKIILKTRGDVYFCAHGECIAKCIHRKLNVADFQSKHRGKCTLDVNM